MGLPTVAVVLSVRNGGEHLARSIESVLAQTGVDLELRVYDNGSNDGSLAIAQQYMPDGRVAVTRNPLGLTFPHSMNMGLEATTAEYFVAWACDDEMRPGNLQHKVEALASSGAGIALGGWEYEGADGGLRGVSWPAMGDQPKLIEGPGLFPMIATANAIAMPTVVMRTDALRAVGGFDVRPELTCDWLLWLRLALRVSAVWLPAPLVLYRQHDDNGVVAGLARGHVRARAAGDRRPGARGRGVPAGVARSRGADPLRRGRLPRRRPAPARPPHIGRQRASRARVGCARAGAPSGEPRPPRSLPAHRHGRWSDAAELPCSRRGSADLGRTEHVSERFTCSTRCTRVALWREWRSPSTRTRSTAP